MPGGWRLGYCRTVTKEKMIIIVVASVDSGLPDGNSLSYNRKKEVK